MFAEIPVEDHSVWEKVQVELMDKAAYMAVTEEQAVKMFKYVITIFISVLTLCMLQGLPKGPE